MPFWYQCAILGHFRA